MNPMEHIKTQASAIETQFLHDLAQVKTEQELEAIRIAYLSRQGSINTLIEQIKNLSLEEKRVLGPLLNELKKSAQAAFTTTQELLANQKLSQESKKLAFFDVSSYKPNQPKGSLHLYTQAIEKLEDIFITMGFEPIDGPEVENDYHNFGALNIPPDHPARDMQDTFWLTLPHMLLRTHTSSVQIHTMHNRKPPIAMVSMGRAYRNEATDASHDFMFMQCEGLFIDKNVGLPQLLGTIKAFLQSFFDKKDLAIRTRPGYFPFVEPGLETDMSCYFCKHGCSVCKKTGWIELGGAGLIHPNVLRSCNIDPKEYTGFAWGFGLTRLVMLKHGINDIRLLHSNKLDFLKQF